MDKLEEVVLATANRGKLRDFQYLFAPAGIRLVTPADLGIAMEVEETGNTFLDNARLKARAIESACRHPTLADDSGLVVPALGGAPGVQSARYAGEPCDDHANNRKLIEKLKDVSDRRAFFVCVLVLRIPGREEILAEGRCEGMIIDEERGTNGFGYDAVFYRPDLGCTFGQAAPERKNALSHRAAAVRALLTELARRGVGFRPATLTRAKTP